MKILKEKFNGGAERPAAPALSFSLLSGIGAFVAVLIGAYLSENLETALLMAPIGASCFLAFGLPHSPLAQPRNILFGHLIATAIAILVLDVFGGGAISLALAVGLAISAMKISRNDHAPAGADPLVVFAVNANWDFLFTPVLSSTIICILIALIFNNMRPGVKYPQYW